LNDKLVILPAHNEGRFIREIISQLRLRTDAHILVIDDGSTDDTFIKIKNSPADHVIRHAENQGYGKALIQGFGFALRHGYKKAVTMDCDAQHEPKMVEEFFRDLETADIVSGSRYMDSSPVVSGAPKERARINRIISRKINKITGYNLTDAFCGFKAYRAEGLKKLDLDIPGYGLPLQIWLHAARTGLTVKEIPVALIYHTREEFPGALASPAQRLKYYEDILRNEQTK
jgi:dolichol-phosphate mannosyltransferase